MNKKIILILIALIIILGLLAIIYRDKIFNPISESDFKVEYLTVEEKIEQNISPDLTVQALRRDSGGNPIVYKIIRQDSDVITDPSQLDSLRPMR